MTSSTQTCDINGCKRACRAVCLCCQQYLCRHHLKEHDELIDAKLPPLVDKLNTLSDQLNKDSALDTSYLNTLSEWRDNAHDIVDQYYARKRQEFERNIRERSNRQKQEVSQLGANLSELIRTQEATQEQIVSITASIRSLERDVNIEQQNRFIVNPLVIDDSLVVIRDNTTSNEVFASNEQMNVTMNTSDSVVRNDGPLSARPKQNSRSIDCSSLKSLKESRWDIEEQRHGITDVMRVNILGMIGTVIDTNDKTQTNQIAQDMKCWLDENYGKDWTVKIHNGCQQQPVYNSSSSKYFKVTDTRSRLSFIMFNQRL